MIVDGLSCQFVNGTSGDPGLLCFYQQAGMSILFDAGNLESLPARDLLRVQVVCVTHCHIDHFIGFDRILRVNIPHGRPIHICGPRGIAENVAGKLRGYLWNLIAPGHLEFFIHEVLADGRLCRYRVSDSNFFEPELLEDYDRKAPLAHDQFISGLPYNINIAAEVLDHGTEVVAYRFCGASRYKFKVKEIECEGLTPGPWVGQVQRWAESSLEVDQRVKVGDSEFEASQLLEKYFEFVQGPSIGYVTDIVFSKTNIDLLRPLMFGVSVLVCESSFRADDWKRAFSKKHLTTRQAALIGRLCQANSLQPFHFSRIYGKETDSLMVAEVEKFLSEFESLSDQEIESILDGELANQLHATK